MTLRLGVFPPGEGERRYATIAEIVAQHTEPESVVITLQHAGSIRYYAGRETIRFDALDERWLDRAVEWLHQQGRPAYFLLEDADLAVFRQRFGAHNRMARDMSPIVAYKAHEIPGWVYLYDPRRPEAVTLLAPAIRNPTRCPHPAISRGGKGPDPVVKPQQAKKGLDAKHRALHKTFGVRSSEFYSLRITPLLLSSLIRRRRRCLRS